MARRTTARINPEVLRWARVSAGLEPEEAARQIKSVPRTDPDRLRAAAEQLQQWETGESQPTIQQARRAAEVYKRPFAALYLPEVPSDPPPPSDFRRLTDATRTEFSHELRLLIRLSRNRQKWASQAREERGASRLSFVGIWSGPREPQRLARVIREQLGASTDAIRAYGFDGVFRAWYDLVERAGVLVFRSREVALEELRGFALADPFAPAVFVNSNDIPPAQAFTLLHEVAHIFLGSSALSNPVGDGKFPPGGARIEVFCNRVASEVLMPPAEVQRILRGAPEGESSSELVGRLRDHFRVSNEHAARRLLDLRLIDQGQYDSVRAASRAAARAADEGTRPGLVRHPVKVAARHGEGYVGEVLDALDRGAISFSDVSGLLGVNLKHLEDLEYQNQRARARRAKL